MVLGTDEFIQLARAQVAAQGLPGLPIVTVPHPIGGIPAGAGGHGALGPGRHLDHRLDEGVPGAAGAALPFPAQDGLPAGLADEATPWPRHR